jgi:apolipoprotein N-acyltransferase
MKFARLLRRPWLLAMTACFRFFRPPFSKDLALLSLGASLYALAFPPVNWTWAAWLALAPLFLVLREKTPGAAFLSGISFGILWCLGVGYWVFFTIDQFFSLSLLVNVPFVVINFALFSGLPTGMVALGINVLLRHRNPWLSAIGTPALWVSGEFLRANPWFGVSWGILGYTQYQHLTLIQIADVTSVYGISFLLALSGYAAAEIIHSYQLSAISYQLPRRKRTKVVVSREYSVVRREEKNLAPSAQRPAPRVWQSAIIAVGLLVVSLIVTLGYGTRRLQQYALPPDVPPLRVAMVQGGIPTEQRWQPAYYASTLLKYAAVTSQGIGSVPPDLVVWPEFAVSFYLDQEGLLRLQLGQFAQMTNSALLLGAPRREDTDSGPRFFNSAYLFAPTGELVDVYDKIRLVPFAEYRPFSFLPTVLDYTTEAPSDFTSGQRATIFSLAKSTFGITICYEAAYPSLPRQLVRSGAQLLVNISNDTWLGEAAAAVEQHFAMAVLRAVENKRYLVRIATAGITSFVDPTGHAYQRSTVPEAVIRGEVFPLNDETLYTRSGEWFSCTCLVLTVVTLFISLWQTSKTEPA